MKINQIGLNRLAAEKIQQTEVLMNKVKFTLLTAGLVFAMAFTFSCSVVEDIGGSSSSSGGGNSFSYCLVNGLCLDGPYTSKECSDLGGLPNNSCGGGSGSSSSNGGQVGGGSSSSGSGGYGYTGPYGSIEYGGQTYRTVQIGTQTWFAENLNYDPGTGNSACYDNQPSNCDTYGRLYDWSTAMDLPSSCNNTSRCSDQINNSPIRGICPTGWHIPSNGEWGDLVNYVGGSSGAGTKLKSTSDDWNGNGNGTNSYGFSALPGGYGNSDGSFSSVGLGGWWSATESSGRSMSYRRLMSYDSNSGMGSSPATKSILFNIRCLQD